MLRSEVSEAHLLFRGAGMKCLGPKVLQKEKRSLFGMLLQLVAKFLIDMQNL